MQKKFGEFEWFLIMFYMNCVFFLDLSSKMFRFSSWTRFWVSNYVDMTQLHKQDFEYVIGGVV